MPGKMFGELFKELRQAKGLTLRNYCRQFGKDPSNMSKMERGLLAPPTDENELTKLALSLNLREDTEEWNTFFTTAFVSAGRIPADIMEDEALLSKLPLLLRSVQGKISEDQFAAMVEVIKKS